MTRQVCAREGPTAPRQLTLHSVRVMGQDRPGVAAEVTQKLAEGGINLRGFSLSVIGRQYLAYAAVDSLSDANKVIEILKA